MKKCYFWILCMICLSSLKAQQADSVQQLQELRVSAFEQYRSPNTSTASVRIIDLNNTTPSPKLSLVHSLNNIAGVRMEERSPGSYRINIRGSSLRSPFGVRNVKVYWNDIPVTDAGGNTYFNQFAWNNFSRLELFKGPAGSLYGAGTGGLILLNNLQGRTKGLNLEYLTGSYQTHNILADYTFANDKQKQVISFAHQQSEGYRVQSAMKRKNASWSSEFKLTPRQTLKASVLYTDLWYETPGGLTLSEFQQNPGAARPAAGIFPGAETARAAIHQKNLLAGVNHLFKITDDLSNNTVLFAAVTNFENAAVRNFEKRKEPQWGGRTSFVWNTHKNISSNQVVAGVEWQHGNYNIRVSNNVNGAAGNLQTNDDVRNRMYTAFLQNEYSQGEKWTLHTGISVHQANVRFNRLSTSPNSVQERSYKNEVSPRIALVFQLARDFYTVGSVSRGFSPPTTAELLPSTGIINTSLEAEYGWNYEWSLRKNFFQRQLQTELTAFYLPLQNALVQRRDLSGADYFVNAGKVIQKGLEAQVKYHKQWKNEQWIQSLLVQTDYTYNHFYYKDFIKDNTDFSGNAVPSVPKQSFSFMSDITSRHGWNLQVNFYSAASLYLNDANTAKANAYELLGARLGWKKTFSKIYKFHFFVGVDNLLDQVYSLGNDINAAAGRYYNVAAPRNYYGGLRFSL